MTLIYLRLEFFSAIIFQLMSTCTKERKCGSFNNLYHTYQVSINRRSYLLFRVIIDYCAKKETTLRVGHSKTTSGYFSANCTNIFHKTRDQRNILRCLTCLNLNWVKSYNIKHNFIHFEGFSNL